VRSIKEECLDRMIPIGERHFRRAIAEYVEHYHQERNHQGLANRLIADTLVIDRLVGCSADRGWVGCSISTGGPPDGLSRALEQYAFGLRRRRTVERRRGEPGRNLPALDHLTGNGPQIREPFST